MITVHNLSKTFHPKEGPVLEDITFSLSTGRTLSIIGPSGCGKTTLLYILAKLKTPSKGKFVICNSVSKNQPGCTAIILQNFGLFPWKSVYENVALGMKIRKISTPDRKRIAAKLLSELGLTEFAQRYPAQLSGGQKQRVAIARALATNPDILLMDEPFSSLDALTRERLQNTMLKMWRDRHLTYIIVTHSVEEAVFLGGQILVLSDSPARIKKLIDNPEFGRPQQRNKTSYFDRIRQIRQIMEI